MKTTLKKLLSFLCILALVLQFTTPALAADSPSDSPAPDGNTHQDETVPEVTPLAASDSQWVCLVPDDASGNDEFVGNGPEAFVLTRKAYTSEAFSFVVKFISPIDETLFRFVTKYVDDQNWCCIAFDGNQDKNPWFSEYKENGNGAYPDLSNLPVLNQNDEIKFAGAYGEDGLTLKVENLTTRQSGSALISHAGVQADKAGKLGFGAAGRGTALTDIQVRDFVVGEDVFDSDAYRNMIPCQGNIGSWGILREPVNPGPTAVVVDLSATRLYKGETASIVVRTADPNGGITGWDNTSPAVAVVDGNVVKALTAGTTNLTAHLTDGTEKSFGVTVVAEENVGLHGVDVTANTEELNGEGAGNGGAKAASDGDSATYWHSQWHGAAFTVTEENPAIITVDLGADHEIHGIKFQQKLSGSGGVVKKYSYRILDQNHDEILSGDPTVVPLAQQENGQWIEISFAEPLSGAHYIEISVLEGHEKFAALAEIQAFSHMTVADQAVVDPVSVHIDEFTNASVKPGKAGTTLKGIVFSSSDPSVFTVDGRGLIQPHKPGKATLIASNAAGVRAEASVTVSGIKSIQLTGWPEYILPEENDLSAVRITVFYTDDTSREIPGDMAKLSFDPATRMLTATYFGVESKPEQLAIGIPNVDFTLNAPVAEAVAPLTIETESTIAAIEWAGALIDGCFDYETVYTANVTVKTKAGYRFSDDVVITGLENAVLTPNHTVTGSVTFDATEDRITGWIEDENGWKFYDEKGNPVSGMQRIDGHTYYFDETSCHMVTGFHVIGSNTYYFNEYGHMQSGWFWIDTDCHYASGQGVVLYGWQQIEGDWYYLIPSLEGRMATGWLQLNGFWFYMTGGGRMQTGWCWIDGVWYYMDENGHMQTGWQQPNGYWFFLDGAGHMQTGWCWIDGVWYYMDENGHMQTGWQELDGSFYFLDGAGHMLTGWQQLHGHWFFLDDAGRMQTGWCWIDGIWYYMDENGHMQTGWQEIDGSRYFLDGAGHMQTGWCWIGSHCYYLYSSGALAENTVIDGYPVNGRGEWVH